ncbi:YbfB/YjiJ family MFS transporter [Dactylosporangium darangshiense]|uniref:MFS transporter n=1 Tax=Dactylosporangium darangshiense TaxID=579108 RepID=A0ABP8D896_9ACTN
MGNSRIARIALGSACAIGLGRFAYGLVLPAMTADLHWSLGTAATLSTANGAGYLVGALMTPPVTARWGTVTTFRLGLAICAASIGATAAAGALPAGGAAYAVLLLTRAVTGLAGALVFVTGAVLAPGGTFFAGTGVGIAISGAVLPPLLAPDAGRWPLAWLFLAVAAAGCTAAAWTAAAPTATAATDRPDLMEPARRPDQTKEPDRPSSPDQPKSLGQPSSPGQLGTANRTDSANRTSSSDVAMRTVLRAVGESARPVARGARLWRVAVAYALFAAGYLAYLTFLSSYLQSRTASAGLVAGVWALLGLAVLATPAVQRPAVPLAVLAIAAIVAWLWPQPVVVAASALAFGSSFMAVPAAVTGIARGKAAHGRVTTVVARLTVVFAAGQMAGPWLAGLVADRTTPAAALVWTAALCAAAAVVAARGAGAPAGEVRQPA